MTDKRGVSAESLAKSDSRIEPEVIGDPELLDLHEILENYESQLRSGQRPSIDDVAAQYPKHGAKLKRVLAMVDVLSGLSADMIRDASDSQGPRTQPEQATPRELGDFRLLREIGRGGMGIVYEAEQLSLNRRVAIKVLPFAALLDRRQLERFRNEARAAAMLKHPHIVNVLSVGFERGVHFYAMELIEGCSLADVVRVVGDRHVRSDSNDNHRSTTGSASTIVAALSTEHSRNRPAFYRSIARLGIQAAQAIQAAHEAGVVHRDIKPSNLMLDQDGMLLVTDFGLARIQEDQGVTMTGDLVGTLRYMSPEQTSDSRTVDHRTDIYSLGATLFELAGRRPAFSSTTKANLVADIQNGNAIRLRTIASDIPRDLETIITKAMSLNADARYQSAHEFESDLNRFLAGKPVTARRARSAEIAWRWCLRNRAKAALFSLLTTLLFALAIGGPIVAIRENESARAQAAIAARQRHEAYDSHMARAHEHIEHGEIDQAVTLLKEYLPATDGGSKDYRSFEWFEMVQRCKRRLGANEIQTRFPVLALAIAPNGDIALAPLFNGPIAFDAQTRKRKWPIRERVVSLHGLAYSADGRYLLSVGVEKKLQVWDAETGAELDAVDLESEGDSVIATVDGTIAVGLLQENADSFPRNAIVSIQKFRIVDGEQGISVARLGEIHGPRGATHDLATTTDGRLIAAGSDDGILRVWELSTGNLIHEFTDFSGPVLSVDFSPNGQFLCGGGGIYKGKWLAGEAFVYDLASRRQVATVHPDGVVEAVTFTSNDQFATGGRNHHISLWRSKDGQLVEQINAHVDTISSIEFDSSSGNLISGSHDNFARIWKLDKPMPFGRTTNTSQIINILDLAISRQNDLLASSSIDRGVRIWNPHDGSLIKTLGHTAHDGNGCDFSPDGKQVVTISAEWPAVSSIPSELAFWDCETAESRKFLLPNMTDGRSVAFSPSGQHVAIASYSRLALWNINEQRVEREIDVGRGFRVVFSRDGQLVATPNGLWKYPSLENVLQLSEQDSGGFACDVNPDNTQFAVSDASTNDVILLSAQDGNEVKRLRGHEDVVLHASFSNDGKRLATGSQSGVVVIWNLETGDEIIRYRDHQFWVWCAIFSDDDLFLASSQGGRIQEPCIFVRRALDKAEARTLLESTHK